MEVIFSCVDCGQILDRSVSIGLLCSSCGRIFEQKDGIWNFLPSSLGALAKEEIEFHDHFDEDATDVHQLRAWRNVFYHTLFWQAVRQVPAGSVLLELGSGSGFDAKEFAASHRLIVSDISPATVERLLDHIPARPFAACALDAEHLPFQNNSLGGIYTVAVWHHMSRPEWMIAECARVLSPGGILAIGMEPNATYFKPMKWLRPVLMRLTHTDPHHISHADVQMTGFTKKDIENAFAPSDWESLKIKPAWFLAGFLHYGLEGIYRMFKLRKRWRIPVSAEKAIVALDEMLFKIPGVQHLGWHWIVVAKRQS